MVSFVRSDHIGRPVFATDSAGVKVWTAAYLPFGGVRVATGTPPNARFPGQWFQSETGLHQNWMRDYDPTTGRYMQADPLGLVDGASVYGYARQSPGRYVDPRGMQDDFFGTEVPFDRSNGLYGFSYDPRVLPGVRPDPNHNFPTSFDDEILMSGSICGCGFTGDGFYVERSVPGALNGREGYYELGIVTSLFGNATVVHRFFNPQPKTVCLPFWPRLPG